MVCLPTSTKFDFTHLWWERRWGGRQKCDRILRRCSSFVLALQKNEWFHWAKDLWIRFGSEDPCGNNPGFEVWAFGSRVHGRQLKVFWPGSVVFTQKGQLLDLGVLRNNLTDSDLTFTVDVSSWTQLPDWLKQEIFYKSSWSYRQVSNYLHLRSQNSKNFRSDPVVEYPSRAKTTFNCLLLELSNGTA